MSDSAQRTEWAEHLRDEARVIAQQQVCAGATHGPVTGPLPYTQDDITGAVRAAVLGERERCLGLVQALVADRQLAEAIAGRLRAG